VAIGYSAGYISQQRNTIAIGTQAGNQSQGSGAIAIGTEAGYLSQKQNAIAIGTQAGYLSQGHIGSQLEASIAIGAQSGYVQQEVNSVAIGAESGHISQSLFGVSIGYQAGYASSRRTANALAIGYQAGKYEQSGTTVSIGYQSGYNDQSGNTIAIGYQAGYGFQGNGAIAIGYQAGYGSQGPGAIAIGIEAGALITQSQGQYSICIGKSAVSTFANSIVIDACGSLLDARTKAAFYVAPIRSATTVTKYNLLMYDTSGSEVLYSNDANSGGNKTFIIDHPTNHNKYLVHACLEGPEVGIYYRGKSEITNNSHIIITLPEYVKNIGYDFTIQLTPIFSGKRNEILTSSTVNNNQFIVYGENGKFFWLAQGKRGDIEVEPLKSATTVNGTGPYKWLTPKNM
jgi:hypothetical protein